MHLFYFQRAFFSLIQLSFVPTTLLILWLPRSPVTFTSLGSMDHLDLYHTYSLPGICYGDFSPFYATVALCFSDLTCWCPSASLTIASKSVWWFLFRIELLYIKFLGTSNLNLLPFLLSTSSLRGLTHINCSNHHFKMDVIENVSVSNQDFTLSLRISSGTVLVWIMLL